MPIDTIGAEFVRDVLPGEVVTIDKDGIKSDTSMCLPKAKEARCVLNIFTLQDRTAI